MDKQYCDICGEELSTNQDALTNPLEIVCPNCGSIKDLSGRELILTPPVWGKIEIDLSGCGDQFEKVFNLIRKYWINDLEEITQQGLFRGQFLVLEKPVKKMLMYGPSDTVYSLNRLFERNYITNVHIDFKEMDYEVISKIRDEFENFMGWK